MLDKESVYRLQIAVLNRAVLDWMDPDVLYRREELIAFFNNPRCEYLYNPFPGITLPEMLEVLKHGRHKLDRQSHAGRA